MPQVRSRYKSMARVRSIEDEIEYEFGDDLVAAPPPYFFSETNFSYLRAIAYLVAAKLKVNLPSLLPT
jgi:hypothetical protein